MSGIDRLIKIMKILRDPNAGCPWDRGQTSSSIAPYTIEEAHEVALAAEASEPRKLKEELGDLLFHVVFHSEIADEVGQFSFDDVASGAAEKLVRRHPHVFSDTRPDEEDHNHRWEIMKAEEREKVFDDIPTSLPALMYAQKIQKRVAGVGFDWADHRGPRGKIAEELLEVDQARIANDSQQCLEEMGDLLFAVVNYARHLGIDAEQALRYASAKFRNRFSRVTDILSRRGLDLGSASLDEMDAIWEEVKKDSSSSG